LTKKAVAIDLHVPVVPMKALRWKQGIYLPGAMTFLVAQRHVQ
jgi:hypothetical protein